MSPSPAKAVEVRSLTIGYGRKVVQRDLNFSIHFGEVFVILGGSGCGKSSLLKNLIGLYQPIQGEILIQGEDITAAAGDARDALLRKFGVMYQSGALFGSMTVIENVMLPMNEFTTLPAPLKRVLALEKLTRVGLGAAAELMPDELSGGMRKRAAIARALALEPNILFLDEPSAGLDPVTSAGLDQLILGLAREQGVTFVVVTHELQSIFAIADRCVMLDTRSRTLIAEGRPAELRDHSTVPEVRQFFHREAPDGAAATPSSS